MMKKIYGLGTFETYFTADINNVENDVVLRNMLENGDVNICGDATVVECSYVYTVSELIKKVVEEFAHYVDDVCETRMRELLRNDIETVLTAKDNDIIELSCERNLTCVYSKLDNTLYFFDMLCCEDVLYKELINVEKLGTDERQLLTTYRIYQ